MRDLPLELIFVLVFGAVALIRSWLQRWRNRAASIPAQAEAEAEGDARPEPFTSAQADGAAARFTAPPRPPPPEPAKPLAPRLPRRTRRFTRAELMPDRRAVQDAIVIAAILQPCHAKRTHDSD
ncbi:MAG: hypothetical protein IPG93_21860 [Burkholderiales bacterium]|nr:hypothetical protein [Burkholderiales bacterium]